MSRSQELNALKRHIFYEALRLAGRVYIVVQFSDDVIIGKRGFSPEEKENGILLILNKDMKFSWEDWGISATLAFGTTPQQCTIPAGQISVIYSPELNMHFQAGEAKGEEEVADSPAATKDKGDNRVVKVDFRNKS